jgi:signal transduction histidine kinase
MNKAAIRFFLCCTLVAAVTAILLLCFNFFCFLAMASDYNGSPENSAVMDLNSIESALATGGKVSLSPERWCILIAESGDVVWSVNMPNDIPSHYTINYVAQLAHWFISDYPVYLRTCDDGLLVLGLPKDSVGKYNLDYSEAWFSSLPQRIAGLVCLTLVLAIVFAFIIGQGLYRRLRQLWHGIDTLSQQEPVSLPETGVTAQVAAALNRCSATLQRKNAALAKRDDARLNWVNGISHDILTPLAVIMGKAEAIQSDTESSKQCQSMAAVIIAQTQKVKALVADLNLMSSLENDMQPSRLNVVKLCPLIRSVAAELINGGLPDGFELDLQLRDESSRISCDESLIRRALFNLLSNCVTHNPKGCSIELVEYESSGRIFIEISDNGAGVPQATLDSLSTIPKSAHGLGLPMAYRIINAHGGSFSARNADGFHVKISLPSAS